MSQPLPLEFLGSFPDPLHPLEPPGAELALVGRSNVGKSSLLNALAGRRRLARVSATPGKTELLNVYRASAGYVLDLPGYGWARRSRSERAAFRKLLEGVVRDRATLRGVLWLLDIRHSPSEDDRAMQDLLAGAGRPALIALTKGDKLTRAEQRRAVAARASELGLPARDFLVTSSTTGLGIDDLRDSVQALLKSA